MELLIELVEVEIMLRMGSFGEAAPTRAVSMTTPTIAEENQNIFPKTTKADLVGLAGRAIGPLKT